MYFLVPIKLLLSFYTDAAALSNMTTIKATATTDHIAPHTSEALKKFALLFLTFPPNAHTKTITIPTKGMHIIKNELNHSPKPTGLSSSLSYTWLKLC